MDAWKTFLAVIFLCTALAQTQDGSATTAATTTTATTSTTTVPGTSGKTASNTTTTSATRRTTISSILSPKNLPKSEVSSVPTVTAGSPSTVAAMTESSTTELSRNETERCLNEKLPGTQRWQSNMEGSSVTVEWGYGPETCSTLASCTGLPVVDDIDLPPQMIPREIQTGVTLNFISSRKPGQSFAMQPIYVTEDNFNECVTEGGTPVIAEPTHSVFQVDRQFLQPGNNYFIVQTSDPLFQCDFGLRLNVTVKTQNCVKTGDSTACSGRGQCVTYRTQALYQCRCCHGFSGDFCDDLDACVSNLCQNNATCEDLHNDPTGTHFRCSCPKGYIGDLCEHKLENPCDSSPCANNGSCTPNELNYACACMPGYSGDHCEVEINECDSSPCKHGICVNEIGGYQCFCIPGHGGKHCDIEYNECQSNPCKNSGFCVDKVNDFECECGPGYRGKDCSEKVDLCFPNPCQKGSMCFDHGNYFSCKCHAGFAGHQCEIDINECDSSPCKNGGKCHDKVNGFFCDCPPGYVGTRCQTKENSQDKPLSDVTHSSHSSRSVEHVHSTNLYIIVGTSSGTMLMVLLVLAGCYCHTHWPERNFWPRKYSEYQSVGDKTSQDLSSILAPGPSHDAIYEANALDYSDSTLNSPIANSLKPKRV